MENKFANVHKGSSTHKEEDNFAEKFYNSISKEYIDLAKRKKRNNLYKWDNEKIALTKILANFIIPYKVLDETIENLFNENIKKNVTDFYLTDDQIKENYKNCT